MVAAAETFIGETAVDLAWTLHILHCLNVCLHFLHVSSLGATGHSCLLNFFGRFIIYIATRSIGDEDAAALFQRRGTLSQGDPSEVVTLAPRL